MRYDHFSMLPERAFQPRNGRHGMTLEGGGGGGGTSTTYTSNIPEWLRPQTEALLGAATKEYFNTELNPETGKYEITSIKPYEPYSKKASDYIAGFTPLQQQTFGEIGRMTTPEEYQEGAEMTGAAGLGGMGTARTALGYGTQGSNIGQLGLGYGGYGADIGQQAMGYGRQAAGMGGLYEQMATSPESMQAYMSPYVRNVIEQQKESAIRDAQKANLAGNLGAVRTGTYGGARQLLAQTERERNLAGQLGQIEATGLQNAFERAQQAQQYGISAGLQGLQGAQQGLGTALQGGQLGLSGIQQALAGQQLGLQGVQGAQAGYGLGLQAGRGLADIATAEQTADLARLQAQGVAGATQQEREQAIINQGIQNFAMQQQYPYQQLAGFSGLLRGYSTPTTTVSQYSAYNPAAQMAGLVAQGAGAYGAMGGFGKAGGGIINEGDVANESENESDGDVKNYAKGGITSLDQKVLNDPTSFSPDAIQKGIDNESISKMVGAIGLDQIATARKKADQAAASQQGAPQGTVLADLRQQVMGIDSLPTNLGTQEMAGGGIIAFEKGGLNDPDKLRERDEFYKSIGLEGYEPDYTGQESNTIEAMARSALARREALGIGADEQAYRESLRKRPEELAKQREMDRYLALMKFGAAMGGAKTPNFLEALSQGTTAAIPEIAASEKAYRTGTAEAQRGLADIDRATRAEKVKALEGAESAYSRYQERKLGSEKDQAADRYIKRQMAAAKLDPNLKNMPPEVLEARFAREYAEMMSRQEIGMRQSGAAIQQADVAQEQAITKATQDITKKYNTQILMAETPAQKAKLEAQRDAEIQTRVAEIRGSGGGARPTAPATNKPTTSGKAPDISAVSGAPKGSTIGNFVEGKGWEIKGKDGKLLGYAGS